MGFLTGGRLITLGLFVERTAAAGVARWEMRGPSVSCCGAPIGKPMSAPQHATTAKLRRKAPFRRRKKNRALYQELPTYHRRVYERAGWGFKC